MYRISLSNLLITVTIIIIKKFSIRDIYLFTKLMFYTDRNIDWKIVNERRERVRGKFAPKVREFRFRLRGGAIIVAGRKTGAVRRGTSRPPHSRVHPGNIPGAPHNNKVHGICKPGLETQTPLYRSGETRTLDEIALDEWGGTRWRGGGGGDW